MAATARDHYNQGIIQKKRYLYAKALASFEAALALEAENPEFLVARGNMLYALERYQEALEAYQQAESLAGRHRRAAPGHLQHPCGTGPAPGCGADL